ncbi:MAG TPA: hypothetical protein VMS96_03825, partial [Terriglobales bacterium]|nr:hypothetical protein [Terriglobales bacterium]
MKSTKAGPPAGVDNATIWKIQQYSLRLDEITQAPSQAPMHSMRAPLQSPADALRQRDQWITTNLNLAQSAYQGSGAWPHFPWTMYFAFAGHTLTDSTSPAHMHNGSPIVWPSNPSQHGDFPGSIETWDNMTPELEEQNIKAIQHAYEQVTGKKCGCEQ